MQVQDPARAEEACQIYDPTTKLIILHRSSKKSLLGSVPVPDPNPDPPDPNVLGPPKSGSGSTTQRYGSGSFYYHAKIVRKTLILTIL
jgi:hypothetical protein